MFIIVNSSKLNVPRVLLPVFNDFSSIFLLEATEGGCYKWSTTRNDIILLTTKDEDPELHCSTKVAVSTITKEAARNIAVVLAEDVYTKQMLRCDIIVDVIHKLLITTTTRELFMEEAPEDFEVKAYDDQGNEFSTLEGIVFEWNIISLGPSRDAVTVRLPYPEYKHIATNEVQLMVVANLLITPAEVYVMPGDVVPFRIYYLNNGRMEEIALPDSQYYLEAEDLEIGSSNKKTGNVTALKEGKTRIVLRDRNVGKDDTILKLPAATLHVVQPDYLVINVLPHKNWAILVGDHHDIVTEVYTSDDHRLYLGGSVQVFMEIAPEFRVSSRSPNGSWVTGYGIKSSVVNVQATLDGVYNEKTGNIKYNKPLTAKGDLLIYPRITLSPSEVILPWDPITRPKYEVDLVARGGDGRFLWTSSDHAIGLVTLEDSVTLSSFKPLRLIEPTREIVLAIGTSVNLVYVGGPRPIMGRAGDHQRVVVSEDEKIARATDITQFCTLPGEDFSVVQIVCRKLGETDIKLMISNIPTASNCKSQTSSVTTRITCGKPRKVTLQPELRIADVDACPMDLSSGHVVVQSTKNIDLDVFVYDDCGTRFLNISSFNFEWLLTPFATGELLNKNGVFPKNITIGNVPVALKSYQTLKPLIDVGNMEINVTISGYKTSILKKYGIISEWPPFVTEEERGTELGPITASLALYLVDNAVISPSTITLFNHPGNKQIIKVKQGSGYFELALSTDDVASVRYTESSREIEVIPLKSGELTIQLVDLCLVSRPATLLVSVISVGIIRVEMADKVEVGKCIPCIVRLYDENDNLMVIPEPGMIDLRPDFENKIANIQRIEQTPLKKWGVGEIHYTITGVVVGDTKLVFTVSGADEDIDSAPLELQVFQPLKLYPRNGSIVIGAVLQFTIKGVTKVFAQSVGIHPFRMGAMVPFWCGGIPDISPMILGSLEDPPILFKWTVDDKLLVDLSGVFHPVGVFKKKPDRVAIKVFGLQPGKTRLYVNATVPGRTANRQNVETVTLSAWIDIEIIQEFSIISPEFPGNSLLMAPFSEVQLETNLDYSDSKIVYWLPGDRAPSTELLADKSVTTSDVIVSVSPTGLLKSYGILGHALLIIICTDELGLKRHLSVVVEVKTIHYMNINVIANWRIHSDSPLRTIPLGTEFQLRATFHDSQGNKFHAGPTDLKVRTSRCDLLKVVESPANASVWIYTKKPGNTMVKAWADGIQKTADYVKINVEQSVRPMLDHLTSGDIVCLWTPVVTEYNKPGTWRSSDTSLMFINPALDIGFVGNREGVVVLTHSLLQSAPIQIHIYPVSEIEFLEDPALVLTNGELNSIVRVVLVLQSEKSVGIKTNNLIQGWRCRTDVRKLVSPTGFKCFAEFSNKSLPITIDHLFNVINSWVPETGQYACKLINLGIHGSNISVLSTNVTLWAATEDDETTSRRLNIKFLPHVFVPEEILLAENSNTGDLTVIGLPEVLQQIEVRIKSDSSILFVGEPKDHNETSKIYQIQLIDYHWRLADLEDAMGIVVSSPITKQNVKVGEKMILTF
ncbi:hypothetical protein NQ314_002368 [Rhamnusium bicolor]|uniref:Nuclear pore membrane glycoprotein 210 n=1 Tax=Rhamnusium bicolor TaxID=1586634 RepID=A0AAV8ZSR4_9CUCU|nr:hypothetical protein NQ314_002368 [Rhamnusium bicolor]